MIDAGRQRGDGDIICSRMTGALCAARNLTLLRTCWSVALREVWHAVLQRVIWEHLTPTSQVFNLAEWWSSSRKLLSKAERRCFDSAVILISWMLWNERNRRVFDHQTKKTVSSSSISLRMKQLSGFWQVTSRSSCWL
jgi:hypothetical protein